MAETSVTPQVGDIWMWRSQFAGSPNEYWLIMELPATAMCLSGPETGETDEITIDTELDKWEKVA